MVRVRGLRCLVLRLLLVRLLAAPPAFGMTALVLVRVPMTRNLLNLFLTMCGLNLTPPAHLTAGRLHGISMWLLLIPRSRRWPFSLKYRCFTLPTERIGTLTSRVAWTWVKQCPLVALVSILLLVTAVLIVMLNLALLVVIPCTCPPLVLNYLNLTGMPSPLLENALETTPLETWPVTTSSSLFPARTVRDGYVECQMLKRVSTQIWGNDLVMRFLPVAGGRLCSYVR